jgi:iron complex transport system substrate-binding protein
MRSCAVSLLLFFLVSQPAHAYSRIVTLAPVVSEWTAELLGEVHAHDLIVGVSEYSNYPPSLKNITTVGPYHRIQVEQVAALHPDLVLASAQSNDLGQIEQLKRLKLKVVVLPEETFAGMPGWIKNLGLVVDQVRDAQKLSERWIKEVAELRAKHPKKSKRVFLEIQHDPLVTIGGASFLNEAFALIGLENIFASLTQAYPKVSKEAVLKAKPERVFILDLNGHASEFEPSQKDWGKYGFQTQILPGDRYARCSFLLLKGLRDLSAAKPTAGH